MPPDTLFHYTTQSGLLGVLGSDSIWATKIHYLNDAAEYQLGFDICSALLEQLVKGERSSTKRTKIKTLMANLRQISRMNVCVASFSEHGDLLSQWRAYSGGVAGFSLGLRSSKILEQCEAEKFFLAKCIYDPSKHSELIEELVTESLAQDFNTVQSKIHPTKPYTVVALPTGGDFSMKFARLAAILKSEAFHEEGEWRVISKSGINVKGMSFRPGASMLIPYIPFQLGTEKQAYLASITLGPTPHPQLAEEAVRSMLARWNASQSVKVHVSKAPFRAW